MSAVAPEIVLSPGSLALLPTRPPTPPLAHAEPETAPTEDAPVEHTAQKIEIPDSLPVKNPPTAETTDDKTPAEPREPAVATPIRLSTPPVAQSPHTPNTNATSTKGRTPKSVVFSGKAHYQDAPVWGSENVRPSPSLPPSRTLRATKGILKASPVPIRIDLNAGRDINLAEMLDSAIKQLNGTDKTSRVEAYSTLSRALRASNNLPDRMALNERMGTMLKFLQRDITTPTSKDPTDHSLVTNSLMMLLTLLYFPSISNTIPADFGIFIVDHCIKSFEDQKVSKEVVRSLMQVIFTQNFPLRVMTSERLRRLLFALHNIEQHVASSKILIFRARIYKRLLKQCRSHLITHPEWMPDLFTDMLSTIKDVRYAAIDLGYEAALSLGMEKDVTTRVLRFMSTPSAENGKTYLDFYIEKLSAQFKKPPTTDPAPADAATPKDAADDKKIKDLVVVPKIWTILLLFIRSRPLDRWESLPKWLNLLPPCFNSTDIQCRLEANIAWSRFIFVAHLHESVFDRMLSSAIVPAFIRQLSRRQFGRKSEADYRKAVLGGICTVFYYSYGANTPVKLFDRLWDSTFPLLQAMTSAESHLESRTCAISIITTLFDTSNRRPWNEEYVLGPDPFPTPDQIPYIDSRWINRNLSKIQKLVQPLIERNVMNLAVSQSSISRLYQALSSTVCALSAKEIKVSGETTEYLTYFLNTVTKLWSTGVPGVEGEVDAQSTETFMEGIKSYIMLAVDGLGLLPFMETVTVKSTVCAEAVPRKCVEHLILILTSLPPGMSDCAAYNELLRNVFMPFFADKFAILMAKMLQAKITSMSATNVPESVWKLTANAFVPTLSKSAPPYVNIYQASNDVPLGRVYKDIVKVLEIGLKGSYDLKWEDWDSLYSPLCQHSHALSGTAGESMAVNEPLSKAILAQLVHPYQIPSLNLLMIALIVVRKATHPFDKAAADSAHFKLWGVANSKTANPDPFNALYSVQNHLLKQSYNKFDDYNRENFIEALFHDVDGFLERCSASFIVKAITLLQPGFIVWLQDTDGRLEGPLYELIKCFFTHICALLAREPASSISLEAFEPLLTAGFQSKHSEFINLFATMWNRLFQDATEVQYTEGLKDMLLGLQPELELVLPGLQESSEPALVDYRETQAPELEAAFPVPTPATKSAKTGSRPSSRQSVKSLTGIAPSGRTTRSRTNSRSTTPANAAIATPVRLRHDNSQVDFVAIEAVEDDDSHTQALTEHQKEVRERQRQESHFLPSLLRTTSDESQIATEQVEAPAEPSTPPKTEVAPPETPKTTRSFDGYIESSPTPRRSATPTILDQDMSDVPSSPLQSENVRRYPLIPDMHKRASAQMREDWPDFSSPVNSSPVQPLRLTRSQKRAAENSSQKLADTLMADADSQPGAAGNASLSLPLALPNIDIKQEEEADDDNAALRTAEKRNPKRARKSLSELPPLHIKTRSSARSRSLSKLSDALPPMDVPSTQDNEADVPKGDTSQDTQESDVCAYQKNAGATPAASRTQKRRRQSSITETPSQPLFSERTLRRRSTPRQATPTPTPSTRRNKRRSSGGLDAPPPEDEENADDETDANSTRPRVSDRAATPGIVSSPAEDSDAVKTLASSSSSSNKRKRRRSSTGSGRAASRKKKRSGKVGGRSGMLDDDSESQSRESSQGTADSQPSEDLEPGAEVSIDTQAIMQITTTADGPEAAATVEIKEEPKEPSSPLSELSEEDMLVVAVAETQTQAETKAEAKIEVAAETPNGGVPPDAVLPSDEEAESQVLSELAAARIGEAEVVVVVESSGHVVPPTAESEGDLQALADDPMDVDAAEVTGEAVSPAADAVPDTSVEIQSSPADVAAAKTPARLMGMLRSGLQSLRGMAVSREEMYEIEDLFVDFKRELYDAERRGRS